MTPFILFYLIIGMVYVKLEHDLLDEDADGDALDIFFTVAHQVLHYARIMITWPLYLLEDSLIWLENNRA